MTWNALQWWLVEEFMMPEVILGTFRKLSLFPVNLLESWRNFGNSLNSEVQLASLSHNFLRLRHVRSTSNFRVKFPDSILLSATQSWITPECKHSSNIIPDCEQNWKSFPLREQLLHELCFLKLDSDCGEIEIKLKEDCGTTWNLKQIMLLNFIRLAVHHLLAARSISKPWKHSRRK